MMTIDPRARIGHVHLTVSDLDRALAFYRDVLGFEVTTRYGTDAVFLSAGGYHHHLGLNTWAGRGAPPAPSGSAGPRRFTGELPPRGGLRDVVGRLGDRGGRGPQEAGGFAAPGPPAQRGPISAVPVRSF